MYEVAEFVQGVGWLKPELYISFETAMRRANERVTDAICIMVSDEHTGEIFYEVDRCKITRHRTPE